MANIFLKPTAKFNPFSYQEMLAPVKSYTDAYNALENELVTLDVMAGDVASKLSQSDKDTHLRNIYNNYNKDLQATLNTLHTNGLNPETKKQLAGLKARYSKELNPINEAYKAYQEDQKYLNKMAVEHPEILIEGAGTSVSDYMNGQSPQMRSLNTEDLMTEALNIAKTKAGRTYKESKWTPTAGGRFLERTTEIGLNDKDFNNALAYVENPNITAEDLGISEEDFNKVKDNASLLSDSIDDILNTPSYTSLSDSNKLKAYNAAIKGIRAGFGYKKDIKTEADPMFTYNLKMREEKLKALAKKKEKLGRIGSNYFATPQSRIGEIKSFLHNGTLSNDYARYFDSKGGIKKGNFEGHYTSGYATQYGWTTPYNATTAGQYLFQNNKYEDLITAVIDLGLNPNTVTQKQFEEAINNSADVIKRQRASITSDSKGFATVQSYIEQGLRNNPEILEIVGLREASDEEVNKTGNTNKRYRVKSGAKYKDLLNDENVLDIVSVDMDYSTGQRSFSIRDKKGNVRDFLMPAGASFEANDSDNLAQIANNIHDAYKGYHRMYNHKTGKTENIPLEKYLKQYHPEMISVQEYIDYLQGEADLIFGSLFNYFGAEDIND